jgi:S1-C subfamily serine protease
MKRVVPSLINDGAYRHPWLGIAGIDILPGIAEALALEGTKGVLLIEVFSGGPADQAGLRVGTSIVTIDGQNLPSDADVIVGIDGHQVRKIEDILVYLQRNKSVGDITNLEVRRDGSLHDIPLVLGERPPL